MQILCVMRARDGRLAEGEPTVAARYLLLCQDVELSHFEGLAEAREE